MVIRFFDLFRHRVLLMIFCVGVGSACAEDSAAQVWDSFRGGGTNVSSATELPITWSPSQGVAWTANIPGYGQSSPVIWHDTIFLTSIEGPQKETCWVHAFDLHDGSKVWSREFPASQTRENTAMTSRAAPTPVVDANGVYAFFESGELVSMDHQGNVRWERSLSKEYGETSSMHGLGSSLAQTQQTVIVLVTDAELSYLLAVDKGSGKNRWKVDREKKTAWTSPVVTDRNGKPMVIVSVNGRVEAYDGTTGNSLWFFDEMIGNTIPSVSISGDYVVLGAAIPHGNSSSSDATRSNGCLRLIEKEGKPDYEWVWNAEKATTSYATPLVYQGRVYYVNKAGVIYCVDLKTGKQQFSKRIAGPCWVSPLGANDHVYFFTKRGPTVVLRASNTFEKIAINPGLLDRDDNTVYGVAAVNGTFIIRTGQRLFSVRRP